MARIVEKIRAGIARWSTKQQWDNFFFRDIGQGQTNYPGYYRTPSPGTTALNYEASVSFPNKSKPMAKTYYFSKLQMQRKEGAEYWSAQKSFNLNSLKSAPFQPPTSYLMTFKDIDRETSYNPNTPGNNELRSFDVNEGL